MPTRSGLRKRVRRPEAAAEPRLPLDLHPLAPAGDAGDEPPAATVGSTAPASIMMGATPSSMTQEMADSLIVLAAGGELAAGGAAASVGQEADGSGSEMGSDGDDEGDDNDDIFIEGPRQKFPSDHKRRRAHRVCICGDERCAAMAAALGGTYHRLGAKWIDALVLRKWCKNLRIEPAPLLQQLGKGDTEPDDSVVGRSNLRIMSGHFLPKYFSTSGRKRFINMREQKTIGTPLPNVSFDTMDAAVAQATHRQVDVAGSRVRRAARAAATPSVSTRTVSFQIERDSLPDIVESLAAGREPAADASFGKLSDSKRHKFERETDERGRPRSQPMPQRGNRGASSRQSKKRSASPASQNEGGATAGPAAPSPWTGHARLSFDMLRTDEDVRSRCRNLTGMGPETCIKLFELCNVNGLHSR